MTTIVYKDGVIASDSMVVQGNNHVHDIEKVHKLGGTRAAKYVAMAGDITNYPLFLEWYKAGANRNKLPKGFNEGSFEALVIWRPAKHKPGVKAYWYDSSMSGVDVSHAPFLAIGCGSPVALGALHMGATAEQAVEAACKVDIYTRLPVRKVEL